MKVQQTSSQEPAIRHNCSLVGISLFKPNREINQMVADATDAQQHRGEEAMGIAQIRKGQVRVIKGLGLRPHAVPNKKILALPSARIAIGHTRYTTAGKRDNPREYIKNAQPFPFKHLKFQFAICHNGTVRWKEKFEQGEPNSDTYGVGKAIAAGKKETFVENTIEVLSKLNGAYIFLFATSDDKLFVASDPWHFRPLVVGELNYNGTAGTVVTSETVGLNALRAKLIDKFPRGVLAEIRPDGLNIIWTDPRTEILPEAACSFEKSYFADAASLARPMVTNHTIRDLLGQRLAQRYRPEGDFVTPVPNSGWSYAEGLSKALKIPLLQVIHVNRYKGRNFIKPHSPDQRIQAAFLKYRFIPELIKGKKIIVVDDSIVRGYTTQGLILALFKLGAEKIELMIGIPPVVAPCFWGIDFPSKNELIHNKLMEKANGRTYPERLAEWLVWEDKSLMKKLRVSFQKLDDYVSIIGGVPAGSSVEKARGCFHCVSGIVPRGALTD